MTGDALETLSAAGFQTNDGLRYAAGDRDFYLELLDGFASEQTEAAALDEFETDTAADSLRALLNTL